jgi:hypothetical protein
MALTIEEIIALRSATVAAKADLAQMIELAESQLKECTFGDQYNNAVALLVLHLYAINDRNGSGGSIRSEKEGQLARSFGSVDSSLAWASTSWGQELIQLVQSLNLLPRTRMMTCPNRTS